MASHERCVRTALAFAVCLTLIPVHSLPLKAEEPRSESVSKQVVATEEGNPGKIGIASYYAQRYNGRKTTTGVRYRPEKLTAAHQDLPFGTRVKVTNLDNHKEVTVTVNDRCRRRKTPFIDLSRAAAKELGFLGKGTARVAILPLTEDPS